MPREHNHHRHDGVRKRASNACIRCRQQKIRCSGSRPCQQCTKRSVSCAFDDRAQKILVSRGFITDLQRRVESSDHQDRNDEQFPSLDAAVDDGRPSTASTSVVDSLGEHEEQAVSRRGSTRRTRSQESGRPSETVAPAASTDRLTNPFSSHTPRYVTDGGGRPWYLGVSSNWSFNRRVLSMAHERVLGSPMPTQNMLFDGTLYDLSWNGSRESPGPDTVVLPSSDYAIYLINAVKFHCGQMFHLFDEASFMREFSQFHNALGDTSRSSSLWYVHYLLILAFGKAFVVRGNSSRTPPGAELFVQAMRLLPDITLLCTQPTRSVEVLCCAALYLQCLDFRCPAYNMIGQALRIALEQGMHTSMQDQGLDESFVQRCRNIWWTVYMLDRQMSSLMGVPLAVRDEDITASLPTFSGSPQKALALELHVTLSKIISQILNTVYGVDGRLDRGFVPSTKAALQSIASVTDQLMYYFELPRGGSMAGISRLSAYLHLLHHQCVLLATRPLLFTFLKIRLDASNTAHTPASCSGSARVLLQMCIESSQKILNVLAGLKAQSLLETFLPFDLEATLSASMVLILAPTIDPSLLESHIPWADTAYSVLDEMVFRGNLAAAARKTELQQLESILNQIPFSLFDHTIDYETRDATPTSMHRADDDVPSGLGGCAALQPNPHQTPSAGRDMDEFESYHGLTAEQLLMVADNLDLDGIDWLMTGSSDAAD